MAQWVRLKGSLKTGDKERQMMTQLCGLKLVGQE